MPIDIWAAFEAAVAEVAAKTEPDADGEVTVWITAERTDDVDDTDSLVTLPRETPAERDTRIVARYHDGTDTTTLPPSSTSTALPPYGHSAGPASRPAHR